MVYRFVRVKNLLDEYVARYPTARHSLWLDNLGAAIDASQMEVVSVGYDNTGDPMTLLLKDAN